MSVVQIKQFKNKKDQPVAGLTPERAVYDENGVRLNDKLKNLNIENITQAATSGVTAVNTAKTTALNEISSAKSSSLSAIRSQEASSVAAVSAQGESYQEQIDGLVDKIELYNLDVISGLTGGNHYSLSGNGQTYILTVESGATATGVIGVVINGTTVNTTVNKNATVNQVASALAATSYTSVGFKARAVGAVVYLERTTGGINPATVSVNVASTGVDMEVADGPVGTISALGIISGIMPADARIPGKFICFNNYESDMETWQYIGGTVTSPSSWKQEGSNAIAKIIDGGVAFTEDDGQVAGSAQFDPEADTVHKAAQYLSPSEKAQVLSNLGITGIDAEPTSGSTNLVMSGGVEKKFTDLLSEVVYDISAAHDGQAYADLTAALGTNGSNLPESVRKGGVSVRFVQSGDNKYVQYFLTKNQWSAIESDWEKVNVETKVTQNLNTIDATGVKSADIIWYNGLLRNDGTISTSLPGYHVSDFIPVIAGKWYYYAGSKPSNSFSSLCGYSSASESDFVSVLDSNRPAYNGKIMEIVIPSGITHVRIGFVDSVSSFAGLWEYASDSIIDRLLIAQNNNIEGKADNLHNPNIINPDTVTNGKRLKPDGTLGTLDNSYVSDYIPVFKNQTIKIFDTHPTSVVIIAFAAYDIDKNFVRGVASNVDSYTQQGNEAYVRICMPSPTDDYPTLFANFGTTLLPYSPYLTIKDAIDANGTAIKGKLDKLYSDNLVDMSKVALSYFINKGNGKVQPLSPTNNNYFVSDFIPVNGKNIYTNAYNGTSAAIGCWVAYAEDKETVTRYSTTSGDINYVYQTGDYYVRFCFYTNDFTDIGASYIGAFASYDELKPYTPYSEYFPLELLKEELDERVPEKQSVTPVVPDYVYSICDDVENNSLALYADHFVDLPRASHKVLFKSSGTDKRDIYAPISSINASTEELNGGVNKKETAISDVIVGDYADANIALVHRSILNTYTANQKIRVLCIGDSVTDGTGSNYPKEITDNSKYTYWRLMQMFCLRDKKNHNNTGYDFLSIGKQSSVTYTYDSVQHKVYAEGRGGWSIDNYLHDAQVGSVANLFYDADKVWSGDYATELNSAGVKFSLASYLAKYKTLADDGVTRLVVGDTAGTEITDINECDVCTPNVIVLQLSHNNGGNTNFYEEDMPLLIKAIKNEYPNIPIILSAIDETGCYNTQLYPMVSAIDAIYASLHTQIVKVAGIIKSLVGDFENVWQCPNNFIQPTALSMTTRPVNRAESIVAENDLFKFGAEIGMGPNFHPNAYANAAWAYEMLACIKWVLSSQN